MTNPIVIKMVSAKNCDRCAEVKQRIASASEETGVVVSVRDYDSSTHEAIDLGIKYGLDDVPSFVVGDKTFCGTDWNYEDLKKAFRRA